jgi:hypothetical protein
MLRREVGIMPLLRWAQNWAQLDRKTFVAIESALDCAGLLTTRRDQASDAVWLVLALCTGLPADAAVQEARRIAELLSSEDAEVCLFAGLVDVVNLIRGGRHLLADFVMSGHVGRWIASLTAVRAAADASLVAWNWNFEDSAPADSALLRRTALLSRQSLTELAAVLGPLPAPEAVALDQIWPTATPLFLPATTLH